MAEPAADDRKNEAMDNQDKLWLRFAGGVIEHLGIQMYQSPVNAIAELIANAWDAEATRVEIELPSSKNREFVIRDNGLGMTRQECQDHYLNVGRNRRGSNPHEKTPNFHRPVLGRKGIGKFAGFGIAKLVTVDTISQKNGEETVFQMDLEKLLQDEKIEDQGKPIPTLEHGYPGHTRTSHGTTIVLSDLSIGRTPSVGQFKVSMARRFLLQQEQEDFNILVNGEFLPDAFAEAGVEYLFPQDMGEYRPSGVEMVEGWGVETVANRPIRWRFMFFEDTIDVEELKGVAVFSKVKLAQRPFLFNLTRGLTGQHGVEYLAGQVQADYIDTLEKDLIATERQRVNWEHPETQPLLEWGQGRLRESLKVWSRLRAQARQAEIERRIVGFGQRLERLERHERRTVESALKHLARIDTLDRNQLEELGSAILTAWEKGRLRDLIDEIARSDTATPDKLLDILLEAKVMAALQTSEVVKTKLETVGGLRRRIERQDLENAVRDFIAENPWLISPEWETFVKEKSLKNVIAEAVHASGLSSDLYRGRVDLTMSSGRHLLVLEFMRPGARIDKDHLDRFETYVDHIKTVLGAESGAKFKDVTGYLVADQIISTPTLAPKIKRLENDGMYVKTWQTVLEAAEAAWREFFEILEERGGNDPRVRTALERLNGASE